MQHRSFIKALSGLVPYPALGPAASQPTVLPAPVPVTPQESPIAGFQPHRGEALRSRLRPGDPLQFPRCCCVPVIRKRACKNKGDRLQLLDDLRRFKR